MTPRSLAVAVVPHNGRQIIKNGIRIIGNGENLLPNVLKLSQSSEIVSQS